MCLPGVQLSTRQHRAADRTESQTADAIPGENHALSNGSGTKEERQPARSGNSGRPAVGSVSGRSEAAPYQSGDALLDVARAAGCEPNTLAAIEEAVRDAERKPDMPIQSRYIELATGQVETLGL